MKIPHNQHFGLTDYRPTMIIGLYLNNNSYKLMLIV